MIKEIRVKNYKAFKDATIPIKPITVFLGANSAGKSSIIQLLLLLQQTAEASESYRSALKISGRKINIGKCENLFFNKDTSNPISIELFYDKDILISHIESVYENVFGTFGLISIGKNSRLSKMWKNFDTLSDDFRNEIQKKLKKVPDGWVFLCRPRHIDATQKAEVAELLTSFYEIKKYSQNYDIKIHFTISFNQNNSLGVSKFSIGIADKSILTFDYANKKVYSDSINLSESKLDNIYNCFSKETTSLFTICMYDRSTNHNLSITEESLVNLTSQILTWIRKDFTEPKINHISPLRAHPQRYYMLDKADLKISLDTLDANAIAEVLKDNPTLKKKVNLWFKKYDIEIDPEELIESIHRLSVSQLGMSLDITDVGFGISQVLPVVLQGFMSPEKSVTLIEQPEIHLHPKMQAELADLFIDILKERQNAKKSLIVETHSEYLLRRLRRRMAEGKIKTTDVSINLFHGRTKDTPAKIENLPIESKGAFEWPEEFYGDELYKDITEFLKLQSNVDIHTND